MMEFGKSLKQAREAKGLSVAQLAEETHMAPTTISELENEDFSHIAAPIYGRGFVKLYCEAVGLEPKPFVSEFMEIFSGNHDSAIRERPVAAAMPEAEERPIAAAKPEIKESPFAASEPEAEERPVVATEPKDGERPAAAPEPEARPTDLFNFDTPVSAEPPHVDPFGKLDSRIPADSITADSSLPAEPPVQTQDQSPESDKHAFSRYAAPIRQWRAIPPSVWRLGVLALGALVILTLIVLGAHALYRATSSGVPEPPEPTAQEESVATTPAKPKPPLKPTAENTASDTKTKRNPQQIPSLYVD